MTSTDSMATSATSSPALSSTLGVTAILLMVVIWRTRIAPALGLLGLATIGAVIIANFPLLVGDVDDAAQPAVGPLTIGLLCTIVIAITIGVAQSVRLHRSPGREALLLP